MKKFTTFETQLGESVVLTDKAKLSLYKKSSNSGISTDILEEVYRRGYSIWNEAFGGTPDSFAFDRVNSFIADGFAAQLDEDLKKACWKGYEAIGMKKKNGKTVPNCVPVKEEELNKPVMTPAQLADKHGVSVESIDKALKAGIKVEKEHTTHSADAKRIALAHLGEKPDYYKKLDKAGLEENAEKHSKNPDDPASRFIGSNELVDIYKKETPGQLIKRVVRECLEEGDVIHTKFAVKNLQKRGIEGPHKAGAQDLMRNWAKHPFDWEADDKVSYHGTTARIHKDGKHIDVDAGAHGIDPDIKTKIIRKQAAKKTGNVVKIKEAAMQATTAPAPTAADMGPKRLSRYQTTQQTSTIGNQGFNRSGPMGTHINPSSPTTPRGVRSMTSGSTQATAKTLTPQRVSANQPAPKTASAPASAPKPSASFGSSSRPTTVSATSGGMEKSGGYKLSSGMSDAGKAKVKPAAPVQIPAGAGKAVNVLSKVAKFAGPVGAAIGLVADAKPLNKGEDEFARQKSLGITKPNVTPGMGSTKNIEPVKGGAITTKAPDYYKGKVGDYTVKAGDTLSGIASRTGQSVSDLASKNKFDSENKIAAGSKLFTGSVPTPPSRPETESGSTKKKIKEAISEATYKGKKVPLNKPMAGDVKKSKVFVDPDGDGKAQKVNFGDKSMSIKKDQPARKKSYCARSSGQGNLTNKTSANYWSRRAWNCEETEE
jgi:LysM repeat protein